MPDHDIRLDDIPEPAIIIDRTGAIVGANTQASILFGYAISKLITMRVEELMPPEFRQAHAEHLARFFLAPRQRSMAHERELPALLADGQHALIDVRIGPVGDSHGIATIRDVTVSRRRETAQRRTLEQLTTVQQELIAALKGQGDIDKRLRALEEA
jgi:PAS domain S-box-containing protein